MVDQDVRLLCREKIVAKVVNDKKDHVIPLLKFLKLFLLLQHTHDNSHDQDEGCALEFQDGC